MKIAHLIVDVLKCFCPANGQPGFGELAVPDGDKVVPVVNSISTGTSPYFQNLPGASYNLTAPDINIALQDWHGEDHISMACNHTGVKPFDTIEAYYGKQTVWPVHGIANTPGADFHPDLNLHKTIVWRKGMDSKVDSYSGFYNNDRTPTGLNDLLSSLGITILYVTGLATDVCVLNNVLDALQLQFKVYVFAAGCRGLAGANDALKKMEQAGAVIIG
jgi:nicotinamidase-related amidase